MKNICFILSSIISFITCAQKASVSLSADVKTAQVGDLITFTVKSNIEGTVEIKFPGEFIQGYGTTRGMNQVMDYNSGKLTTIYYFSQNGAFRETGTYSIQAFVKNKNVYKSNKITVRIEKEAVSNEDDISKKNCKQPVFGLIKKSKTQVYEGEAIVLEPKIYSRLDINMLDSYQAFEVDKGAEVIELEKAQRLLLSKENLKGTTYLTFTYGKSLVFLNTIGKTKVKPFEMTLQYNDGGLFSERIGFTSNGTTIEVLPLPAGAPNSFIGAVGKFDLEYSINKNKIHQGDVARLTVIISGTGNLHNINKPEINLPKGVIIYGDPEIKEDFSYGMSGAEGRITYIYNLQFNSAEVKELAPVAIAYFDPSLKKYIQIKGQKIGVDVEADPTLQALSNQVKPLEKNQADPVPLITEKEDSASGFYGSKWFWPTVLSPLVLAFVGFIFFKRKKEPAGKVTVSKKAALKYKQDILQKIQAISIDPHNLGLGYQSLESNLKSLALIYTDDPQALYSKGETLTILEENKISEELIGEFKALFMRCEEARFSFQNTENELKSLIQSSSEAVNKLNV